MDQGDLEQLAIETYERAGLDAAEPVRTIRLARLVLNDPKAVVHLDIASGHALRGMLGGRERIGVRRGLPREYMLFYVGHELAHIVLERAGVAIDSETEECCNYLSAAFIATRPAVHRLHRAFGFDLAEIANATRSTQTWAGLRVGEVERVPLATISPAEVRRRGPEAWIWPDDITIRRVARATVVRPGLRKVPITDGRGRVALVGSDD